MGPDQTTPGGSWPSYGLGSHKGEVCGEQNIGVRRGTLQSVVTLLLSHLHDH